MELITNVEFSRHMPQTVKCLSKIYETVVEFSEEVFYQDATFKNLLTTMFLPLLMLVAPLKWC